MTISEHPQTSSSDIGPSHSLADAASTMDDSFIDVSSLDHTEDHSLTGDLAPSPSTDSDTTEDRQRMDSIDPRGAIVAEETDPSHSRDGASPPSTTDVESDITESDRSVCSSSDSRSSSPAGQVTRSRTNFTQEQVGVLKEVFENEKYPNKATYEKLSQQLEVDDKSIKLWFQNRRAKSRKMPGRKMESRQKTQPKTANVSDKTVHFSQRHKPAAPVYQQMSVTSLPPDHPFCLLAQTWKRDSPDSDDEDEVRSAKRMRRMRTKPTSSRRLSMTSLQGRTQGHKSGTASPATPSPLPMMSLPQTPIKVTANITETDSNSPLDLSKAQRVPVMPVPKMAAVPPPMAVVPGWPALPHFAAHPFLPTMGLPMRPGMFPMLPQPGGYVPLAWAHPAAFNPLWMATQLPLR